VSGEEPIRLPVGDRRTDELARELTHARAAIEALRAEVTRLEEQLQTVEGRTLRHEAGQDLAREVKGELAQLDERLESEATLRRDLAAIVERSSSRDHEFEAELRRALEVIARRLSEFEGHQSATDERQRTLVSDAAQQSTSEQRTEQRLGALERRVAAQRDASVEQAETIADAASRLPELARRLDELTSEVAAGRVARQRMEAEIAALRSVRDREAELLDLLEQQRATRTRHESRLSEIEEFLATVVRSLGEAAEERARLAREQAGGEERLRTLGERLEALRVSIVEHMRRQVRADEQAGRRQVEETERELRVARTLLTRMAEQSEDVVQEQPL
jgi:chromosome segregation ATPase